MSHDRKTSMIGQIILEALGEGAFAEFKMHTHTPPASESKLSLKNFIVESLIMEDEGDFEDDEIAAKANYDHWMGVLAKWKENQEKKKAFIAKVESMGLDPWNENVRQRKAVKDIRKDPKYAYDPIRTKFDKNNPNDQISSELQQKIAVATKRYKIFDPSIVDYERGTAKKAAAVEEPEKFSQKSQISIETVKKNPDRWYSWSMFKNLPDYGSSSEDDEEEDERADAGVGPGEERLAHIFGGVIKGGSVSYDVVTPDGSKWEVKALESRSSTIRPGTEGKAALAATRDRLTGILKQLKNFVVAASRPAALEILDEQQRKIVRYVGNFIATEYEEIVGKGEITQRRFHDLQSVMRLVSGMQTSLAVVDKTIPTVVGLNDKKVTVDKPTFLDVAKIVKKSTKDKEIMAPFQIEELVFSSLKDPAFKDPGAFFKSLKSSIKASNVFKQVDGLFVVNKKLGFYMVPRAQFDNYFKFSKISQATPRFKFTMFGDATSDS